MEHLAIMRKSWGLLPKILSGEKRIESRWYKNKYSPWDKIGKGDIVYFKNSGDPVSLKVGVDKVIQFSNLAPQKVREILEKYGKEDGLGIEDVPKFFQIFKDKRYCILVFLKDPEKIKPFEVNKEGFGMMSAWITVDNISKLRKF